MLSLAVLSFNNSLRSSWHVFVKSFLVISCHTAQAEGRYEDSLKKARKCLQTLEGYKESDIENKKEIQATLHSSIGNALLETGDLGKALEEHQMDLDISSET